MMLLLEDLKFGHKHIVIVSIAPAIIVDTWLVAQFTSSGILLLEMLILMS